MLTWTPALAVGVAELDAQHQELFRRTNAFVDALDRRSSDDVERFVAFLEAYAHEHFAAEERWMRAAGYPRLEEHRAEHRRFLDVVEAHRLGGPQHEVRALPLASWLVRWLEEHVERSDAAAARFVAGAGSAAGASA